VRIQEKAYDPDTGMLIPTSTCWAAAMSSWLKGAHDSSWSPENLIGLFRRYVTKKGLDLAYWSDVAESPAISMNYDELYAHEFTFDYVYDKLERGLLYAMTTGNSIGHAIVIYGVDREANGSNARFWAMDPLDGATKPMGIGDYQKWSKGCIIGWAMR
jgi:hypothetical protein